MSPRVAVLCLAGLTGCSAFRLPPEADPDRSRHAYEIVGEVRRADTLVVVPGAELTVEGAASVVGDARADATGRFWLKVAGITSLPTSSRAAGPAGTVVVSARAGRLCVPATRVTLPVAESITLLAAACAP